MASVKYTTSTIFIANPEIWDELRNSPSSVAQEMYADLLMVNSGAILLYNDIGTRIKKDIRCDKITFVYPEVDAKHVHNELYNLIRTGSKEGISFNSAEFRFTIVDVKGETENLIGLEIRFIK